MTTGSSTWVTPQAAARSSGPHHADGVVGGKHPATRVAILQGLDETKLALLYPLVADVFDYMQGILGFDHIAMKRAMGRATRPH